MTTVQLEILAKFGEYVSNSQNENPQIGCDRIERKTEIAKDDLQANRQTQFSPIFPAVRY